MVDHLTNPIAVRVTTRLQRSAYNRNHAQGTRSLDNLIQIDISPLSSVSVTRSVKFCLWNAQSIRNKSASFTDYTCDKRIDLIALTETRFADNNAAANSRMLRHGSFLTQDPPRS